MECLFFLYLNTCLEMYSILYANPLSKINEISRWCACFRTLATSFKKRALAFYISFLLSVIYVNGGSPSRCSSVSMVSHSFMLRVGKKVSAS